MGEAGEATREMVDFSRERVLPERSCVYVCVCVEAGQNGGVRRGDSPLAVRMFVSPSWT